MRKILLDTNFLLAVHQFKVDIFSEIYKEMRFKYKLFVLDRSIEELKKIVENQKGKSKEAAKIALKLVIIKDVEVVKTINDESVDDAIVKLAEKESFIVATQDKELKKRLKEKKVAIIILRQKKKIVLFDSEIP